MDFQQLELNSKLFINPWFLAHTSPRHTRQSLVIWVDCWPSKKECASISLSWHWVTENDAFCKRKCLPFPFESMNADQDNPLLFDVLTASSTSYTANPDETTLTEVNANWFRVNREKNVPILICYYSIQQQLANEHCWFLYFKLEIMLVLVLLVR